MSYLNPPHYKRQVQCKFCYNYGHNKIGCPTLKESAKNGNQYAVDIVERNKIRQCSYCKQDNHTVAKCHKKYNNLVHTAKVKWAGCRGVIAVVQEMGLAKGAFLYAPMIYSFTSFPRDNANIHGVNTSNYEVQNFCIEENTFDEDFKFQYETTLPFLINTLAEPEVSPTYRFGSFFGIPGLHSAISKNAELEDEGSLRWIENADMRNAGNLGRKILEEKTIVINRAEDSEVEALVKKIKSYYPEILRYHNAEHYWQGLKQAKRQGR